MDEETRNSTAAQWEISPFVFIDYHAVSTLSFMTFGALKFNFRQLNFILLPSHSNKVSVDEYPCLQKDSVKLYMLIQIGWNIHNFELHQVTSQIKSLVKSC